MWLREGCCACEGAEGPGEERVLVGDERQAFFGASAAPPALASGPSLVDFTSPRPPPFTALSARINIDVDQMASRLSVLLEAALAPERRDDREAPEPAREPSPEAPTKTSELAKMSALSGDAAEVNGQSHDGPKARAESDDSACVAKVQTSQMNDFISTVSGFAKTYLFPAASAEQPHVSVPPDGKVSMVEEVMEGTEEGCWAGIKGVSCVQVRECASEFTGHGSAGHSHVHACSVRSFTTNGGPGMRRSVHVADLPDRPEPPRPMPHSDWPLCVRILLLPLEIPLLCLIFCVELPLLQLWRMVLIVQVSATQTGCGRCIMILFAVLLLCLLAVEYTPGWIFICPPGACNYLIYYMPWLHIFFSLICSMVACLFPAWAVGFLLNFNSRLGLGMLVRAKVPEPMGKRTEVIVRSGWRVPFWTGLPSTTKSFCLGFEFIFHWWFNVAERGPMLAEALSDHMPADVHDSAGFPLLWTSAFFAAPDAVRLLTAAGADVNASDPILGLAPLHAACTLRTETAQQPLGGALAPALRARRGLRREAARGRGAAGAPRRGPRAGAPRRYPARRWSRSCQRDHVLGATADHDLAREGIDFLCLQPKLKWMSIEALLLKIPQGQRARALHEMLPIEPAGLGRRVKSLRLPDLLFCHHEGSETELRRRRLVLWEELLRPTVREARHRALSKEEKAMTLYAWESSQGPPHARDTARMQYVEDMQSCVEETMNAFAEELNLVRNEMLKEPGGVRLTRQPLIKLNVSDGDLRHDRFLDVRCLGWALNRNFPEAIKVLHLWGVVPTAESLVRLVRDGAHELVGAKPRPDVFGGSADPALFWRGLVALWLIAAHNKAWSAYLQLISEEDNGQAHIAPLKGFNRIMEKAAEYIEERDLTGWDERVLSPMHVIDILRGTVECSSPANQLEVEQRLTNALPLVRAKHGHHPYATVAGGYRDTKLNLLLEHALPEVGAVVRVIVEVQLVLESYAKVKAKMHAVYRVHRGDFGGMSHGLADGRRAAGGRVEAEVIGSTLRSPRNPRPHGST